MSQIYVSPSSLSPIYATIVYPTEKTTKIVSVEKKPWGKCLKLSMILSIMFLTAVIFIAVLSCALIFATPNSKSTKKRFNNVLKVLKKVIYSIKTNSYVLAMRVS